MELVTSPGDNSNEKWMNQSHPRQTIPMPESFLLSLSSVYMSDHRTVEDVLGLQNWFSRRTLSICSSFNRKKKKRYMKLGEGPKYVSIPNRQR